MLISCTVIQKSIDRYTLSKNRQFILKDFSPGRPEELEQYIKDFNLDKLTAVPAGIKPVSITELYTWQIQSEKTITYEKWIFKNTFYQSPVPGDALFFVLKQHEWKGSKVILRVPGFGVSDYAFRFVKKFLNEEINAGFNIVIYIPPYHMERQEKGNDPGSGLITAAPLYNVKKMVNSVKELRMVIRYLQSKKINSIGTWGGSMGGALTLMLQSLEPVDHMGLMIPVLDWNTFIIPESLYPLYKDTGFEKELLIKAYNLISPRYYPLTVPSGRIQIEAGEFDQLNPIGTIINYSIKYNICNTIIYPSGHSTILLRKDIYKDYAEFLSELERQSTTTPKRGGL